ncbi:MAG TPA: hypothetical protein VN956_24515 [Pyrinomonadaceae bacterium]|nr:hypothetical protein [Pyrinomonadaceae bacterium]
MNAGRGKKRFPPYGYVGILVIGLAEGLLLSGHQLVGHWFTPIVWTGYILFVDALVYKFTGRSLLMTDRLEFLMIAVFSIGVWWLFEFYNAPRFWRSNLDLWWHYHNLEQNPFLRRVGYDWAFATIFPLLFLTAELFAATLFKHKSRSLTINFSRPMLIGLVMVGAAGATGPLLYPSAWFAPVIWLSFIFLFDPVNALRGQPSITNDLRHGDWRRLWSLLLSGLVGGVLWEFWNYWAISKWTYTVPFFGDVKIFEMPVLGFLGFPPFAVECWVMYIFLRSLLQPSAPVTNGSVIFVRSS